MNEAVDINQMDEINESIRENDLDLKDLSEADMKTVRKTDLTAIRENEMEDLHCIPNNNIPIFGDVFNEEDHPELLNVT